MITVFKNLGLENAQELFYQFIRDGMTEIEAFEKVYSIECGKESEEKRA